MKRALALKELRETYWIAGLALGVFFFAVADLMGVDFARLQFREPHRIPFASGQFQETFLTVTVCLAVVLGFRQSIWESFRGTWLYLLHRPLGWTGIIGTKLLTGIALYLVTAALPILIYSCWAATPGTHASPFEWSMTLLTWRSLFTMTSLYLAAFLCGIRDARWHGSRLLPLVAAGLVTFFVEITVWWPVIGVVAVAVTDALLLAAIFHVARVRDYS